MFFLSSPPQQASSPIFASASKEQLSRPTLTSPYMHDNSYAQAYARAYYAPHSSSPLRTARNANLMSSPTRNSGLKPDLGSLLSSSPLRGDEIEYADENQFGNQNEGDENLVTRFGFRSNANETPAGKKSSGYGFDGQGSSLITPPDSGSQFFQQSHSNLTASSPFKFSFDAQSSTTTTRPGISQWELRSRSSSPSSLLTNQTTRNREQRKSQFLDRLRRRRDDERSEQVGEQILRMDFVKERRGWEEQMARQAAMEAAAEEEEEDIEEEDDIRDEEMSPTEEYDDLLREYGQGVPGDEFLIDDADDGEYERLFKEMEILSQQSQSQKQTQTQGQTEPNQDRWEHTQHEGQHQRGDGVMDLS